MNGKYTEFPYTLCPHILAVFPTVDILHHSDTFVIIHETTLIMSLSPLVYIRVHSGVVHPMSLDKCGDVYPLL